MTRLSEDISQASVQTTEKRDRLESARRACQETAAAIQAKMEACANSVDVAVPMHSTAVKHFAATEIAAVQLIKHVEHPFLIHGNAKGQARHADHFSVTVGSRKSSSDQTCESSHESGGASAGLSSEWLCAVCALEVTAPLTPSRSTPSSSMKTKRRKDNSRGERDRRTAHSSGEGGS